MRRIYHMELVRSPNKLNSQVEKALLLTYATALVPLILTPIEIQSITSLPTYPLKRIDHKS